MKGMHLLPLLSLLACLEAMAAPLHPPVSLMSTESLAAEFRVLRQLPDEPWTPELKGWNGWMHQVMLELEHRLREGAYLKPEVVQLLGEPDEVWPWLSRRSEYQLGLSGYTYDASEVLVYYWRGLHDFLFFSCEGPLIVQVDWFLAYE
ncbi:hypothetical protein [Vitiosangium sp. GDMCC 1.1324]|uniref:hypothetical protein n=1 Tax=Vitiosangium sp. (strain GDMCC 1.1324) TaxID=2138576 RepID=UPI000D3C430B|nr:hypothetical protein [Vitiosangium sp. GDMCC 1.1324]PTL81756.1 hypothetical protein DAT35_22720 [Vitiosangium sp. GDMCC 1.1324]